MPADITTERLIAAATWEWQDVEALMEALIPTVAPGKALRTYQARTSRNKGTGTRPPFTEAEQIASGARTIVNARINAQIDSGRLEVDVSEDGRRRVRLRERRAVVNQQGACRTCNRPFPKATAEKPQLLLPTPPRRSTKVVYPKFPQWQQPNTREGSSG